MTFYSATSYTPGKWGTIDVSFFKGAGAENRGGFPVGGQLRLPTFEIDWSGDTALAALGKIILPQLYGAFKEPRESVPGLRTTLPGGEAPILVDADTGGPTVVPSGPSGAETIPADYRPDYTVYEDAPGGIYETNRQPTDWDAYYRRYAVLNPEKEEQVFDWFTEGVTGIADLGQTVGWWGGQQAVAPTGYPSMAPGGAAAMPARVTVDTRTGKVTPCKRRRRRKLLTESDFNVLLRVATLPNKENVRIVLGKAIGRS